MMLQALFALLLSVIAAEIACTRYTAGKEGQVRSKRLISMSYVQAANSSAKTGAP
jgi:hypothetical protein